MEPLTPRTPDGGDSGTDAELGTAHSGSISRGSSMTDMQCVSLGLCVRTASIFAHGLMISYTCSCSPQFYVRHLRGSNQNSRPCPISDELCFGLHRSTDWQSVNMAVLTDRVKFRDYPDGKQRGSPDGLDSAYATAVHLKASALAGDVSPPSWPPPESQQLTDPRLTSVDKSQGGMPLSVTTGSSPAAAALALTRSNSDHTQVSAVSRHSSRSEDSELNENEQAGTALLGNAHHGSEL